VLTREALIEFEMSGVGYKDNPDHHCTLPFIRNVAGPMDYIPGTLNNAALKEFAPVEPRPMGQGTRAHSMALAVLFESPLQMLPDAQSDYYREPECTRFLTRIPTEWDQIVPLSSKIGDFVTLARRNGSSWYVAAITDWTPRTQYLLLDFLEDNAEYEMTCIADGLNANARGTDYVMGVRKVKKGEKIEVSLAAGGGYVAILEKKIQKDK
jgi:alpha-glucosidase